MIRSYILILFALSTLSSCITDNNEEVINYIKVGEQLPDFTVTDAEGALFYSHTLNNRKSLIMFFDTGCSDCQREFLLMEGFYRLVKDDPDYIVVPISRGQSASEVETYWSRQEFTMPFYIDPDRSAYNKFANSYVPRVYLSNSMGTVIWMAVENTGITDPAKLLEIFNSTY